MENNISASSSALRRGIVYVVVVAALAGMVAIAVVKTSQKRAISEAAAQLQRGFGALAVETLEPYRNDLSRNPDGCHALIQTYTTARRAERLEWAGEACMDHKVATLEVFLGLATAADMQGQQSAALQILGAAAQTYKDSPAPIYAIAQLFKRNKQENEAVQMYKRASALAGDNHQIELEALQYFSGLKRWDDAREIANRLKAVKTENPEVKLIIARALLKGGDRASAKTQVEEVNIMLQKRPDAKAALAKSYPDVYRAL